MPAKLKRCVGKVKKQGNDESSAYAICSSSTDIKRKKGGGWTKGESTLPTFSKYVDIVEAEKKKSKTYKPDTKEIAHRAMKRENKRKEKGEHSRASGRYPDRYKDPDST
jgi:hypothetical protein